MEDLSFWRGKNIDSGTVLNWVTWRIWTIPWGNGAEPVSKEQNLSKDLFGMCVFTYSQTYQPDWKSNKSYSWCQLNIMLINELCLMLDVTQHAPTLHGQTPCLKLAPRSNLLIHWETQIQVKNSKHDNTMLWGPNLIEHI